jgi:membrane associated rhomboid family serine protease
MAEVAIDGAERAALVDACEACHLVWFDADEHDALPGLPPPRPRERLSHDAAEADFRMRAQGSRDDLVVDADAWSEDRVAHEMGLPILEADAPDRRPWATWALLAACVATTVVGAFLGRRDVDGESVAGLHALARLWGFVPADPLRAGGLTFVTTFFAHATLLHVLGNAYFLAMVGARVEGWLGVVRYLGLLLLGTFAACVAHAATHPGSTVPLVGASGGIAALFGWYAVVRPRDRIGIVVRGLGRARDLSEVGWFYTLPRLYRIRLPVLAAFAVWFVFEWLSTAGLTRIAHHAHLGGALAGVGWGLVTRRAAALAASA